MNRAERRRLKAKGVTEPAPNRVNVGDDGVQEVHRGPMNAVMEALEGIFPDMTIVLLVAESNTEEHIAKGEERRLNYISNGRREEMIAVMEEFIRRAKGQQFDPPPSRQ